MRIFIISILVLIVFNSEAQNYQWRPIVPGIDCIDSTFNNCQVSFLVNDTFHNTLWLLGIFEGGGGVSSAYAVGFDGTNWIPFPGIFNASILSYTNCAIMYNGNLILGKDDRIEEFNFSTLQWSTIGNTSSEVLCLDIFNNDLIAGGYFSIVNGIFVNHIAKWNGVQWDTLGSGITGSSHIVMSLEIYNGKLFAGGTFDFAGGIDAWNIASWDGATWSNLCSSAGSFGTDNISGNHSAADVHDMEVYNNKLYITGQFEKVCGINCYLAYWDDTTWHGTNYAFGDGKKLATCNNLLYVMHLGGPWINSFDGSITVTPVDSTFNSGLLDFENFENALYIGGGFSYSAGTQAFKIARLVDIGNGIKELENNKRVKIYPNPTQEEITIETMNGLSPKQITVTDLLGRELISEKPTNAKTKVNVIALSDGIYLLRVEYKNGEISVAKFVKE